METRGSVLLNKQSRNAMKSDGGSNPWDKPRIESRPQFMRLLAASLGLLMATGQVLGAGVVDPGFALPAAYHGSGQLAIRPLINGKTMVVGSAFCTRLNEDGSEDGTYQIAQIASGGAQLAAITPDGRTVIVGSQPLTINGTTYGNIVRLRADGIVDPAFTSLTVLGFAFFRDMEVDSVGRVYLGFASPFNTLGGQSVGAVARLKADGTLDTQWQPNLGTVSSPSLAMFSNDDLLLARSGDLELVRLTSSGDLVRGFASLVSARAGNNSAALVDSAGKILMSSLFVNNAFAYTNSLVRLFSNGVIDPGFVPQPVTPQGYQALAVDRFGRYYAGGGFDSYASVARARLLRLFPDGGLDESFVADCNGYVDQLALTADGRLLVGGGFSQINGVSAPRLTRLLVDGLAAAPTFALLNTNVHEFDSAASVQVPVMRSGPTNAPASISFFTTSGTAVPGTDYVETSGTLLFAAGEDLKLITIDLSEEPAIRPDRDFFVSLSNPSVGTALDDRSTSRIMVLESDAEVSFNTAEVVVPEAAGTVPLSIHRTGSRSVTGVRLQVENGTAVENSHYQMPTRVIQFKEGEATRSVQVKLIDDATENVDHDFILTMDSVAGAVAVAPTAVAVTIADDDVMGRPGLGFAWPSAPLGLFAIHEDALGRRVVGGSFTGVNGLPIFNLVRLLRSGDVDSSFWTGTSPNGAVFSIVEDQNNRLLIAGNFTAYNGTAVGRIARLTVDGSLDPFFVTGSGFNQLVERIEILPDGRILAGGFFDSFNGVTRRGVAILKNTGELDDAFVPTTDTPEYSSFFGHGAFQSSQGVLVAGTGATNSIFRLSSIGQRDPGFLVTLDSDAPYVTALVEQPDGKIVIGGVFTTVNGTPRSNLARLHPDGSLDVTFDPGSGPDNWVFRVYRQPDGRLLLVGYFLTYDGVPRSYAARINEDGSLDTSFDAAVSPVGTAGVTVHSARIAEDGSITLGGTFQEVQGIRRSGLAEIGPDGNVVLQVPEFLSATVQGSHLQLGVSVEPGFDLRLLQSDRLPGLWTPVGTNRTFKRVLNFSPQMGSQGADYFQAELLREE